MAGAVNSRHGGDFFFRAATVSRRQGGVKADAAQCVLAFPAALFNTAATLSVFYALSHGKVVIVEPLVSSNPVLTLFFTAIFLRDLEAVNLRVIGGALLTVMGTILVVLAK
jgi:uncharacterized membrane protein